MAPPRTTPAGAMWFAAPVLVAAPEADDVLDGPRLTIEEAADTAELMTEEALEAMELSAETMLELLRPVAVDKAELRDAAEEFKPPRTELPTELTLERPDCSEEIAELSTEAVLDAAEEREEVSVIAEAE